MWTKAGWLQHCNTLLHISTERKQKNSSESLNLILGTFSVWKGNSIHVDRMEVLSSMHDSPVALEVPSLGAKTITFQRELWGFSFDVVWGYCMVQCGRMLRARWSVYACECVYARCRERDMVGVHQSKGRRARRLAAPDSALQEGLVWWRAHSESSIPQDKSQGPVDRCEFCGFCAQSPETCRVRNLTFAESQIVFLNPSCCLWQFRAKSDWALERQKSGCRYVPTGGEYRWGGYARGVAFSFTEL